MEPLYATSMPLAPAVPPPPVAAGWLSLEQAAAYVGPRRQGIPTHPMSVKRWMRVGLRGIKLRFQYRGGFIATRAEWIEEFFAATSAARTEARERAARSVPPSPRSLERRYEAANERNRKAGIA